MPVNDRTEQRMKPEGLDQAAKPAAASSRAVVLPPRPVPEKQRGLVRQYLQHLKDEVLEAVIQRMIREKRAPFGELQACEVNTHANSIAGQVLMKGDVVPILVTIARYEVLEVDGHHFIELKRFTSSKEWVQAVMERFLTDKRFRLPVGVAPLI
jgi:hypothetical protein